VQLLADWLCFVALTSQGLDVVPANLCSRLFGAALGFWLNGRITFAAPGSRHLGPRQATKYMIAWCVMTLLSTSLVWLLEHWFGLTGARLGKPWVDAGLAALGFLLSKFWIYR